MNIERKERDELNALSKELFGSSNKWRKLVEKGYTEAVTRVVKEEIPGENGAEPTVKESRVLVLTESGGKQSVTKYHTVESVKALMLEFKAKKDAYVAESLQKQAEEKAKKEKEDNAKKLHEHLAGSAL